MSASRRWRNAFVTADCDVDCCLALWGLAGMSMPCVVADNPFNGTTCFSATPGNSNQAHFGPGYATCIAADPRPPLEKECMPMPVGCQGTIPCLQQFSHLHMTDRIAFLYSSANVQRILKAALLCYHGCRILMLNMAEGGAHP